MMFDSKYELGQIVYLQTDTEQLPRTVTYIKFLPGGSVSYELSNGTTSSEHYDCEITEDKNVLMTTND